VLSVFDLTSEEVQGADCRNLTPVRRFAGPSSGNNEGIAIVSSGDCLNGERSFFMTVDDGGEASLMWYRQFRTGAALDSRVARNGILGPEAAGTERRALARPNPFSGRTAVCFRLAVPGECLPPNL